MGGQVSVSHRDVKGLSRPFPQPGLQGWTLRRLQLPAAGLADLRITLVISDYLRSPRQIRATHQAHLYSISASEMSVPPGTVKDLVQRRTKEGVSSTAHISSDHTLLLSHLLFIRCFFSFLFFSFFFCREVERETKTAISCLHLLSGPTPAHQNCAHSNPMPNVSPEPNCSL